MPGGWLGRAPLQSKLADADSCDRCHGDPLWLKLPPQAPPAAGISAPPHRLSRSSPQPRPRETTLTRRIPFSILATRES
jgi:hypothetical protein